MRKSVKIYLTILLSAILLSTSFFGYTKAEAYTPDYTTLKIGLYYGSSTLSSANLQNVTGRGSGYEYGLYDNNRNYTSLNGGTSEIKISILRDRNMYYDASSNSYKEGTEGSVVVGCFHIQFNTAYTTFDEAAAAAAPYTTGFVKYSNGVYYACAGNYLSFDEATAGISSNGLTGCSVTSGTSSTVTVVKTGTNTILFEFEHGNAYYMVVMPVSTDGTKCQTWFKGYRYYGAFQYPRYDGGKLTVYNCVNIEDYVKGVIPYEMSSSWPIEALKAQAVSARTYVMTSHRHSGFDVCTTIDCQVYRGVGLANETTDRAVDETAGKYITYNGEPCNAFYSASDGGATENSENVWIATVPYLRGVIDPYEADIVNKVYNYNWTVTYTSSEITARLQSKGYSNGTIVDIAITQFTEMGNAYKVTLTDINGRKFTFTKGSSIRSALGVKSIRFTINGAGVPDDVYVNSATGKISGGLETSYAIGGSGVSAILGNNNVYAITGSGETVEIGGDTTTSTPGVFTITGSGNGHNVGMSQWGAYSMAKYHNKTYEEILKFYFTGVIIE